MKKYKVHIVTTSAELMLNTIVDEFMIQEIIVCLDDKFLRIEDDTIDKEIVLFTSQIVGIEWEEIKN